MRMALDGVTGFQPCDPVPKAIHPLASRMDADLVCVGRGPLMTTSLPARARSGRSAPSAGQPSNRDIFRAD